MQKKIICLCGLVSGMVLSVQSFGAAMTAPPAFVPVAPPPVVAPSVSPLDTRVAPGWYVGVGAGYGGMVTPTIPSGMKETTSDYSYLHTSEDRFGFAARLYGGYLWELESNPNVKYGLELGYNYYNPNKYSHDQKKYIDRLEADEIYDTHWKYTGYHVDVLGVIRYNFYSTGWNVLGKAGVAYVHQRYQYDSTRAYTGGPTNLYAPTAGAYSASKSAWLPKVAVGLGYDFNSYFGVSLTGDYVFGSKPSTLDRVAYNSDSMSKVASVATVMLNATYHFLP